MQLRLVRWKCLTLDSTQSSNTTEGGLWVFFRKQIARGLFQPVLTTKEYVGLFCVAKKGGKQRLIIDARSVNARMRAPPATPLASSESFSQFTVILPEGCDLHAHTRSAFTPAALPL